MNNNAWVEKGQVCAVVDYHCGKIMKTIKDAINLEGMLDKYSKQKESWRMIDCRDNLIEINNWLESFRENLEIETSIFVIKDDFLCIFDKFTEEIIDSDYVVLHKYFQSLKHEDIMEYRVMSDVIELYVKIIKTLKYVFDYLEEYQY